jgi:uncharacterized lipoprotein YddW (UPF0748 family)
MGQGRYIDYIAPQLYWCIGYPPAKMNMRLLLWGMTCVRAPAHSSISGNAVYKLNDSAQSTAGSSAKSSTSCHVLTVIDGLRNLFYATQIERKKLGVARIHLGFLQNLMPPDTTYPMPAPGR